MSNIYQRGITIVDTETDLPSAASSSGIAVIKDTGKVIPTNGATWAEDNTFTTANIIADGVTDAGPALRTLITQAKTVASATTRVLLKVTPGTYAISGQLDLGPFIDLDMRGAVLKFTGTEDNTKLRIGGSGVVCNLGTFLGINVINGNVFYYPGHKYKSKALIGVEFLNVVRSEIQIHDVNGFTIDVRLGADALITTGAGTLSVTTGTKAVTGVGTNFTSGMVNDYLVSGGVVVGKIATYNSPTSVTLSANATQTFTNVAYDIRETFYNAYNNIRINQLRGFKYALNIHSYDVECWVNENKIYGGNLQPTSDMNRFGSVYGWYFSAENDTCYLNANNNVWDTPCFQLGSPMAWTSGGTGWQTDNIIYNPTTYDEYRITTVTTGTLTLGTTAPTHTSGTVSDGSVNLEYIGPCRRSPVFYDASGANNRTTNSRWESGFGPYMVTSAIVSTNFSSGNRSTGSLFEVKLKESVINPLGRPDIDENCFAKTSGSSAENEIVSYRKRNLHQVYFSNLHLKAVESANGITVPGFDHSDNNGSTPLKSIPSADIAILYDGLHLKGVSNMISVVLNTNVSKRFAFDYTLGLSSNNSGRLRVRLYDSAKAYFTDLTTVFRAWGGLFSQSAFYYSHSSPRTGKAAIAVNPEVKWTRVFLQGETTTRTIVAGINITAKSTDLSLDAQELVVIENSLPLNPEERYSNGTPIAGAFLTLGEQIKNISGTAGQPLYWTVTTSGYLCKAWITATLYVVGSLVSNGGTNYRCVAEHTSSAAFATDSANWVSIGTPAVLTPAEEGNFKTPETFGAVGNGTTDDTTALQTAINAASNVFPLYLTPGKTYKITSTLVIPSNVTIIGAGRNFNSVILPVGCVPFKVDGSLYGGGWAFRILLRDFLVDLTNASGTSAIELKSCYNVDAKNIFLYNQPVGVTNAVYISKANDIVFEDFIAYGASTSVTRGFDIDGVTIGECRSIKLIKPDIEVFNRGIRTTGVVQCDIITPYSERCIVSYDHSISSGQVSIFGGLISSNNGYCIDVKADNLLVDGTDLDPYQGASKGGLGINATGTTAYRNVKFRNIAKITNTGFLDSSANRLSLDIEPQQLPNYFNKTIEFSKTLSDNVSTNIIEIRNIDNYAKCKLTVHGKLGTAYVIKEYEFTIVSSSTVSTVVSTTILDTSAGNWVVALSASITGDSPNAKVVIALLANNSGSLGEGQSFTAYGTLEIQAVESGVGGVYLI